MKKILFITNHSYMFYQFRKELVLDLLKDYEIVLLTPFNGHEEDFMAYGCKVIETKFERRGISPIQEKQLYDTYLKILEEERPNFVITYSIKPNIYGGLACQKLNIPYAVNVQGLGTAFQKNGMKQVAAILYKQACKKADVVFFENVSNAQYFIDHQIILERRAYVLPGAGVNTDYYSYQPLEKHSRFHFLYLGRIMKEKGVNELFSAMKMIKEDYPNTVLDIVGFAEEDYEETIQIMVLDGFAVFHGFQEDPRPYYKMADCVVLPSYHEGLSNVLLEGASTGRLLITSDIPGCREVVEANKTGYLCKVRDTESLYAMMRKAVNLTKEERINASLAARKKIENEFAKEKVVRLTRSVCKL